MDEKKKLGAKVIPFPGKRRPPAAVEQTISGNGNVGVVGDGNSIHVTVRQAYSRRLPPINVQPGEQHVSPFQADEIQALVRGVVKATGHPYPFVWNTVKDKFVFGKYQLLAREKYEPVRAYLRRWIASAGGGGMSTVSRKTALARIQIESKKVPGLYDDIHSFIRNRFGVTSLVDLTLAELHDVIKAFKL